MWRLIISLSPLDPVQHVLTNASQKKIIPRDNFTPSQIKRSKLRAEYPREHANIKVEWASHFPERLELDRDENKSLISELSSMLDSSKTPGARGVAFADSLRQ